MTLVADVALRRGSLTLDAAISVADGEVVALLGPNGSGKTSLLRAISGLEPLQRGRVTVDDVVMDDPVGEVFVPVEARPIGLLFQDYLLFPHLTVLDNVAFGLRARGMARHEANEAAARWLERLGLVDEARQRPGALSGGQQQRAALARVLAPKPRVLLLDEPLAALDVATRRQVRAELIAHLEGFPGARVLVTHDPVEAVVLADRIVVLEGGKVSQEGTAAEIRMRPRSDYIARLVGVNLLRGTAADHHIALPGGVEVHLAEMAPRGEVFAVVRPQAVALFRERPDGTPRNVWRLRVLGTEGGAERVRVELGGPIGLVAEVTPGAVTALDLVPGTEVWAAVKATDIEVYPA
jgi:molybdate transport system ATP-binding protein